MTAQLHAPAPAPMRTTSFTLNPLRWSQRTGALVSGAALTLMVFLSIFGYFIAVKGLTTLDDAAATAEAIAASPQLWIAGVASLYVVVVLDLLAAAGTSALFKPVSPALSLAAGLTRVAFATWFAVALTQLVIAFNTLDDPAAALRSIESFKSIWDTALGLFGVYLLMVAYLAIRSTFMPSIFGILIGIAGLCYIADLAGLTFVAGFSPVFGLFGFIGETAMIFWLFIKGRRLPRN
jgi:hypothetical protein